MSVKETSAILSLSHSPPFPPLNLFSSDVRYRAGYYLSGAHFLFPTLCHCGRSASDGIGSVRALILMICLVRENDWRVELGKDKQAYKSIVGERDRKKEEHIRRTKRKWVSKQWDCRGKLLNRPVTVTHPALIRPMKHCSRSHWCLLYLMPSCLL